MNTTMDMFEVLSGIVYKKNIGSYLVNNNGINVSCSISTKLRRELIYPTADPNSIRPHVVEVKGIRTVDPVAVGDNVEYVDAGDGTGMIINVLPRKNKLVRPALEASRRNTEKTALEQVIVANLDQVVPVFAIRKPTLKWNLLDRYLVSAESLGLSVLICITKMDLSSGKDFELLSELELYREIGYPVTATSVVSGEGISELTSIMQGKLSVFIGKSGVGKTSLLNSIQPDLGLRVNQVNKKTGKGKHTTTHLEMFPLNFGGYIVDTPGMREFGLWHVQNTDLAMYFPEMRQFVGTCKFGLDCSHIHEPGCTIKELVQTGDISSRRYQSYIKLRS
jgi:ribosome biogenesis GTPase